MKNSKTKPRLYKLIENLPLLSIVLPYIDYTHSCVYLMTHLSSKIRKMYLSNEEAFSSVILKNNRMEIDGIKFDTDTPTDKFVMLSRLFKFNLNLSSTERIETLFSIHANHKSIVESIIGLSIPYRFRKKLISQAIIANYFTRLGMHTQYLNAVFNLQKLMDFENEKYDSTEIIELGQKFDVEKEKQFFFENLDKVCINIDLDYEDDNTQYDTKHQESVNSFIRMHADRIKSIIINEYFDGAFELSKLKNKEIECLNEIIIYNESNDPKILNVVHIRNLLLIHLLGLESKPDESFDITQKFKKFQGYSFESFEFDICDNDNISFNCIEDNIIILNCICSFKVQNLVTITIDDSTRDLLNLKDANFDQEDNVVIHSYSKFEITIHRYPSIHVKFDSINIKKEGAYIKDNKVIILNPKEKNKNDIEIYIPEITDQEGIDFSINVFNLDAKEINIHYIIKEEMLITLFSQNSNTLQAFDISIYNLENAKDILRLCNNKSNLRKLMIKTTLKDFQNIVKAELKRSYMLRIIKSCKIINLEESEYSSLSSDQDTTEELEDSSLKNIETKNAKIKYEITFNL